MWATWGEAIVCVSSHFSPVWLFVTPWTIACQAPLSMWLSRQEYWDGSPFPLPGARPNPGIEPTSLAAPAMAGGFFTISATCKAQEEGRLVSKNQFSHLFIFELGKVSASLPMCQALLWAWRRPSKYGAHGSVGLRDRWGGQHRAVGPDETRFRGSSGLGDTPNPNSRSLGWVVYKPVDGGVVEGLQNENMGRLGKSPVLGTGLNTFHAVPVLSLTIVLSYVSINWGQLDLPKVT